MPTRTTFATILTSLCCASIAFAGVDVDRDGSRLHLSWTSPTAGRWELRDGEGKVCATGASLAGANQLDLLKVAAPEDLSFVVRPEGSGAPSESLDIAGVERPSRLTKPDRAVSIYQLAPRSYFARGTDRGGAGQLADLTDARLAEIKDLGADYLWLTGILEHASRTQSDPDVVKGEAGSYYAIYDNWDVSPQIGTLADFEALIERAHGAGLRVIIDFVANHTARFHRTDITCKTPIDFGKDDDTSRFFDAQSNYYYITGQSFTPPPQPGAQGADGVFDTDVFAAGVQAEFPARVTGNDIISASPQVYDWFETVKLNYGYDIAARQPQYSPRPRTWTQMIDVARYWALKGVDGFRVDYAHAVPIEFWREFASELKRVQPNVFLLAEAYESDQRMKLPGFSYHAMLDAGFDSVYNSEIYWALQQQATRPGTMRSANPTRMPAMAADNVDRGFLFTNYLENHDEVRIASRHFAQWIGDRHQRAMLGLAYTAYLALMPAHVMLHGGQELEEDASVFGPYAGDNGRTSIFDFVYQAQTRTWLYGERPQWMREFRGRYKDLLHLKLETPFAARHSAALPSFVDLEGANWYKEESKWIAAYVRHAGGSAYLVVTNADPFVGHEATIHFTGQENGDSLGALTAAGITNDARRYKFEEVFARRGFVPRDPNVQGEGVPGSILYRSGNVPSGLFLGQVPPATTYVFKITAL